MLSGFQGIVGNIPMTALGFATLYLQLLGISDFWASMMVSLGMGAHACGGLIGGWLGDVAARHYPNHGRIAVCQLSVVLGETPRTPRLPSPSGLRV
jgi:hypothetical protein